MTIDITASTLTAIIAGAIIVIDMIIRVIAIIVVPRNRRPTAGMAWLLAIFFIPILGVLIFLLIGLIFWFVMRAVIHADRNERKAYSRIEAEERAKLAEHRPAA